MENREQFETPRDVEVFLPQRVELIDPARQPSRRRPQIRSRKKLAAVLFAVTCLSTFAAGASLNVSNGWPLAFLIPDVLQQLSAQNLWGMVLQNGVAYGGAVMLILLAHEMGHYLQSRRYKVPASLPYFIPMPLTPIGTMGAVIVQGGHVADRKQLFDIAITGPLAGLVFALPIAWFGAYNAEIATIPENHKGLVFGDPLILEWMVETIHRPLAPNEDVVLNPLLFAGWVGIFITALNLIPVGQLDGGHILYTLIGKRAHMVAMLVLLGAVVFMALTGFVAYILMIGLLLLMGPRHPPTRDDTVPLGTFRIILGWLTLAFIIVGFTPMPIVNTP